MSDRAGALVFLGVIAACIAIPLLLSRHNSSPPQYFSGESSQKPTGWVRTGGNLARQYKNKETWNIEYNPDGLPTKIEISRHAVEE